MAMAKFRDRQHVWLRSRVRGLCLHADEDRDDGVSIEEDRASLNAAWTVHIHHYRDSDYVLLHSAAYGRYLAATDSPAPFGHRGFRIKHINYDHPQMENIMWQVSEAGSWNAVLLRNLGTGCYLRANGKFLRWNKGVTVDKVENSSAMMHWIVEPIPPRNGMPAILDAPLRHPDENHDRLIRFVLASDQGQYNEDHLGWQSIIFSGRSVHRLRNQLARRLEVTAINLVMCVRAGRYGRLTPLVGNLRRYGDIDFQVVLFKTGTAGANALRHPNVDIHEDVKE